MTTIATDGSTMAADGLICSGDCITDTSHQKLARLPDGSVVGCCGSAYSAAAFRAWLQDQDSPRPHLADGFEALVLLKGGRVISYNDQFQAIDEPGVAAIGSGMRFALAAMDAGCSPEQAVEIASRRDTHTGGKFYTMGVEI